jgi:hypothetical protein
MFRMENTSSEHANRTLSHKDATAPETLLLSLICMLLLLW